MKMFRALGERGGEGNGWMYCDNCPIIIHNTQYSCIGVLCIMMGQLSQYIQTTKERGRKRKLQKKKKKKKKKKK